MDPILGQILPFGFNFEPRGWAYCQGQLMAISANTALFSLLGTTYGGDGRSTFALPDLRGRVMVGMGQGPGGSNYVIGSAGGSETTTLTTSNLPAHNHPASFGGSSVTVKASSTAGSSPSPSSRGNVLGSLTTGSLYNNSTPDVALNVGTDGVTGTVTVGNAGSNVAFNNMQPFLTVNLCIATVGIFPSRN